MNEKYQPYYRRNSNVYIVTKGNQDNVEGKIDKVFNSIEKAQEYIDGEILTWLKSLSKIDPNRKFNSCPVVYGDVVEDFYVRYDIRNDGVNYVYSWFDITEFDYD